jgi:tetratricopeptide (TPR) repeat protein
MHRLAKLDDALAQENWSAAKKILHQRLADEPENHWLLDRLSAVYYEERNYDKAFELIQQAVELAPDCPLVQWDLAGTLLSLGKVKAAQTIYRKLLKRGLDIGKPPHGEGLDWAKSLLVDCVFRIAVCHQHLGQKTKALTFLKKFMELRAVWNGGIHNFEDAEKRIGEIAKGNSRFLAEEIKKASALGVG